MQHEVVNKVFWKINWIERLQEAQLSQRGRAMPRVVEYFG